MQKIKKLFFHSPIKYITLLFIGLFITIIYLLNNNFTYLRDYSDGLFISGAIIFFCGALSFVTYFGAFDIFSYNIKRLSKNGREKYKSLYDYSVKREENNKKLNYPFIPYFVVGIFLVIISVFLTIFI